MAIMLWKLAGRPEVSSMSDHPFEDIENIGLSANNITAIIWCYQNGIDTGVTPTQFKPNDNGTRMQLTSMIVGYNYYAGVIEDE